jgi:hypothetical protein
MNTVLREPMGSKLDGSKRLQLAGQKHTEAASRGGDCAPSASDNSFEALLHEKL